MIDEIEVPKDFESSEIFGAQDELYGLCGKRNWGKPVYRLHEIYRYIWVEVLMVGRA